jgi:Domain of unknown function (DUF4434)
MFFLLFALAQMGFAQQKLSGSFFMFDRNLSQTETALELDKMHLVGMDKIILISVGHLSGPGVGSNGECTSLSSDGLLYPSLLVGNPSAIADRLGDFLTLADARGMKVYLGTLQTSTDWTSGTEFGALRSCNKAVFAEIKAKYGSQHPSLEAPYWTQEI